jgi:hypothetical protein
LLLALALLHAAGVIELVRRATCEAACKHDGCDRDGTPGDDTPQCPCHGASVTAAAPATIEVGTPAPATQAAEISFEAVNRRHASPDPRDILHVPRLDAV